MNNAEKKTFLCPAGGDPRLDSFLHQMLPEMSKQFIKKLCRKGVVRVNGKFGKAGQNLKEGDRVEIDLDGDELHPPMARPDLVQREGGALQFIEILSEDSDFLVIKKPRSMHSITLSSDDAITVADCVAEYHPPCLHASANLREAGLVQRLDFYTSGIMLAAKNNETWTTLHQEMLSGRVSKTYLALVEGAVNQAVGQEPLMITGALRESDGGKTMRVLEPGLTPAEDGQSETKLELVQVYLSEGKSYSLVRASAGHVSRHQIRAHLASVGHPLLGDKRYQATMALDVQEVFEGLGGEGFFLHAETLEFLHPRTGKKVFFKCPL